MRKGLLIAAVAVLGVAAAAQEKEDRTLLEIRDFLSGEFEPVALADVMAGLRAREASGAVKLVPRPAPPALVKKK
jgi:hypothetical protein